MNDVMEKWFGSFPSMGERGISEVVLNGLCDARLVEPCRHRCNELLEFWITLESKKKEKKSEFIYLE